MAAGNARLWQCYPPDKELGAAGCATCMMERYADPAICRCLIASALTHLLVCWLQWQPEMAAHHIAALASVAAAAFRHHAHNYTLALLATECTTPFVNTRWLLDKAVSRCPPVCARGHGTDQVFRFTNLMALFVIVCHLQHMAGA